MFYSHGIVHKAEPYQLPARRACSLLFSSRGIVHKAAPLRPPARHSRSLLFYSGGIVHKAAAYQPPALGSNVPAVLLLRDASPALSILSPHAFAGPALARGSASSARPLLAAWTGAGHWPPHRGGDPSKPALAEGRIARGAASSWPPITRKTRPAPLTPRVAAPRLDAWCSAWRQTGRGWCTCTSRCTSRRTGMRRVS